MVRELLTAALSLVLIPTLLPIDASAEQQKTRAGSRELTIERAIGACRATSTWSTAWSVTPTETHHVGRSAIFRSPDGARYALVMMCGDIDRDGIRTEVYIGAASSLAAAAPTKLAELFTRGLGDREARLVADGWNVPRWSSDGRHLLMLWQQPQQDNRRVVRIDVETGEIRWITSDRENVTWFAENGGMVIFSRSPVGTGAQQITAASGGYFVTSPDAPSFFRQDPAGLQSRFWDNEYALVDARDTVPRTIPIGGGMAVDLWLPLFSPTFSPDGRYALIDKTPVTVAETWRRFQHPYLSEVIQRRLDTDAREFVAAQLRQLHVVDLTTGVARPLMDAPSILFTRAAWSPNGDEILLGNAFLPGDDADGIHGRAVAVVNATTGEFAKLLGVAQDELASLRWVNSDTVEIGFATERRCYTRGIDRWSIASCPPVVVAPIEIYFQQDINSPPALFARDNRSGRTKLIWDSSAYIRNLQLAHAENIEWQSGGATWRGRLYHPIGERRGRRYPLVIQTHGIPEAHEFSLYGLGEFSGQGPSPSYYAAQMLAARGIAVLQVEDASFAERPGPIQAQLYAAAYIAAIRVLSERGLVDADRVGISGFSATGYHVLSALTHTDFPFAAALTSDNLTGGYAEQTGLPWYGTYEHGTAPFGAGLKEWLENAPAFSVERIRTPLALVWETPLVGAYGPWEMFTRMRQLDLPAEFFVVPDVEHGVHGVINPRQSIALKMFAVNWFDFWLNGDNHRVPEGSNEVSRWEASREQARRAREAARPPLLEWTPTPRQ